ncbi:hypothetical protein [Streptomyces sp. NPDC048521]|uniref:hypothetical protein n=1 Tax=Streptomyces sp. NPDC048521 TaxID=3365566 RepID=UPI00371969EF
MSVTDDQPTPGTFGERALRRLLLVRPSTRLVHAAVEAGFSVRVLADARAGIDHVPASAAVDVVDFADPTAVASAIETAVREHGTQRSLACADAARLPAVTQTAARLGVDPNPGDAAFLLSDQAAMRSLLNTSAHSYVAAVETRNAEELSAAIEQIGAPVVVRSTGPSPGTGREPSYLVEQHLEGSEYGVVTFTVDGMHQVIGIAALHTGWHPGNGCLFPAPLGERDEAEARAMAAELLDLAGYEFGFAYTVVALTRHGLKVAHAHAHFPDEPVGSLVELATGFSAETVIVRALAGRPVRPPAVRGIAAAVSCRLPGGRSRAVATLEAVGGLPGVHKVHLPPAADTDTGDRGGGTRGYVMLTAATAQEAARTVAAAEALLRAGADEGADRG